jgi:hypothetical protein
MPARAGLGSNRIEAGLFIEKFENAQVHRAAIGYSSLLRRHDSLPHTVDR